MAHAKAGAEAKTKEGAVKIQSIQDKIEDLDSSKLHFLGIGAGAIDDDTKEDFYSKGSKDKPSTNLKDNLPPISADRKISANIRKGSRDNIEKRTAEKEA